MNKLFTKVLSFVIAVTAVGSIFAGTLSVLSGSDKVPVDRSSASTELSVETAEPSSEFGTGELAAPSIYPSNNSTMLNLAGAITLTFDANVEVKGDATLNDTECTLIANENQVYVTYAGLTPSTEYTLTIPAGTIGNTEAQNVSALTYKFTTRQEGVIYYADFNNYPEGYYNTYTSKFSGSNNIDIIAKNSTDKTVEVGGMTFFSGTKGRVVAMNGANVSADSSKDYGPETDEDAGASSRCVQLLGGGNKLYVEFPEVEGPVDVTFYLGNTGTTAFSVLLTDENGDTSNPLATFELPAAKRIKKFTYTYPYKGAVKLRLYGNSSKNVNINDVYIVKGEGEGIDKPTVKDEEAPALLYSWPSKSPYAPVEGNIELVYNENIVVNGKASVDGKDLDVTVNENVATIAYSGLENGKTYTVTVPAVADESGNATESFELTFTTEGEDVLYYTDFATFPFSYWDKYHTIPGDAGDNDDIIAKNSTDITAQAGGITYFSGTSGRVVAMGKSNLLGTDEESNLGASQRCIQVSGGENGLYAQLPKVQGPAEITLWVGNSTAKEFSFELRNGEAEEPLATFSTEAEKKMYKFNYTYTGKDEVEFRIYNMGNQMNIHDILVVKAEEESPFGSELLTAPSVWPSKNNNMLPLSGNIILTFDSEVTVAGEATLNDQPVEMKAEGNVVTIAYSDLKGETEYTLTIPAATIGNENAANEAIELVYTSEPDNTLYYTDFAVYPYSAFEQLGNLAENFNIIAANSNDVTAEVGGITYYSGLAGRVVALKDAVNSSTIGEAYGPETEEDLGASNRAVQLIGGGNGLYMQMPEVEGPVDVTLFLANTGTTAFTVLLTDENGDTKNPLASFDLPASKSMKKFTYSYPYKGTVSLRLYNMKNKVDVNDVLIIKGEGEGIEKPVITDEEAPVLLYSWPSNAPYAPTEGNITLIYNEPIVVDAKAEVNGVATEVVVDGTTATIAYSGLEAGKSYSVKVPAVADDAGNKTEALELTVNTQAADVIYYTDFGSFPYAYWDKYHIYPNEAADNGDIIPKNSTDMTVEVAGITYFSGTNGRVVAMGKANLFEDNSADDAGASARCIQVIGGGDDLYLQLPTVESSCDITLWIGNSKPAALSLELRNGDSAEPLTTFTAPAEKKAYKFTYHFDNESPADLRLYNMNNQVNINDILIVKAENSGIIAVGADNDAEAVYYNLQGIRVDNPSNGIYIRVRGNNVDKVMIR